MKRNVRGTRGRVGTATLAALAVSAALVAPADAQNLRAPGPATVDKGLPMSGPLLRAWAARDLPRDERASELVGLRVSDRDEVHATVYAAAGAEPLFAALTDTVLARFGARVDARAATQLDAWIPLAALGALARALPPGTWIAQANAPKLHGVARLPHVGEGPGVTGSDAYRDQGADGSGVVIGIVDSEFGGITDSLNAGEVGAHTQLNFASGAFDSGGDHGTNCAEVIFDHAPGATYRLYRIDASTDLVAVVDDCIVNGVDVLSMSLAFSNTGWADDSGIAAGEMNRAAVSSVLCIVSAGNEAEKHWQGPFDGGLGNANLHDWVAGDEGNDIWVPNQGSVRVRMQWDDVRPTDVYDLYLYNSAGTSVLASSTSGSDFEELSWSNAARSPIPVQIAVEFNGTGTSGPEFEIFCEAFDKDGAKVPGSTMALQYVKSFSSTESPSNATQPAVYSIAAVPFSNFNSPLHTGGIVSSYSSRGPTNSLMQVPDLSGPTNTATYSSTNGFTGTSCAAPNVAGAVACFLSSLPQYSLAAHRYLVETQADFYKDWGNDGHDQTYGIGGVGLVPYVPGTIFLSRDFGNTSESPSGPNFTLPAAVATIAATGGRVLTFPPGAYPEHPFSTEGLGVLIDTEGGVSTFGE